MGHVSHVENDTQARLDACHVVRSKLTYLIAQRVVVHIELADEMCEFASVNLHRT